MTIGEGWDCKLKALPSGSALSSPQQTPSVSSSLLTLLQSVCQSPAQFSPHSWARPQDSSTRGSDSSRTRSRQSTLFSMRTMAWRSVFNEANKTTSSEERRTWFSPQLGLLIFCNTSGTTAKISTAAESLPVLLIHVPLITLWPQTSNAPQKRKHGKI